MKRQEMEMKQIQARQADAYCKVMRQVLSQMDDQITQLNGLRVHAGKLLAELDSLLVPLTDGTAAEESAATT